MTAYAPNWTSRVRFSYFAAQAIHSLNLRFPGPITGSGLTDIIDTVTAFMNELSTVLFEDFTLNSISAADIDTGIFLPQPNPGWPTGGVVIATDLVPEKKAWAAVFVGRTALGNPAHFSLYGIDKDGVQSGQGQNFRVISGESVYIDAAIDILQSAASTIVGNDGSPVTWYDYVNISPNAKAKKKVRRGA